MISLTSLPTWKHDNGGLMSLKRRIFLQPCPTKSVEDSYTSEPSTMSESNNKRPRNKPQEDNVKIIDCGPLCRKIGLNYANARLWFVKDICGVICAVFTWLLVLYAEFVVVFILLIPSPHVNYSIINGVIFQFFVFLAITAHVRAMFTDPGAIVKGTATKENIMKLGLKEGQVVYKCPKCCSIKPSRTHHCSVCRRCIRKMDHHCPWVNNCIGECNQKYFVLFTLYICIISIHALCMSISHFMTCVKAEWKDCTYYSPAAQTVFLIFLIFESLLFGIFTMIMFGSQLHAVCTDETGIESLKQEEPTWERQSQWQNVKSTFGTKFSIHWFSPFSTPVIAESKETILHLV